MSDTINTAAEHVFFDHLNDVPEHIRDKLTAVEWIDVFLLAVKPAIAYNYDQTVYKTDGD
jgi:hypothetical protein